MRSSSLTRTSCLRHQRRARCESALDDATERLRQLPLDQPAHLQHAAADPLQILVEAAGDVMTQCLRSSISTRLGAPCAISELVVQVQLQALVVQSFGRRRAAGHRDR